LDGEIDLELTVRALKGLSVLDRLSDEPIQLLINSHGGDMVQGFAIVDAIQHCRSDIVGMVRGEAHSAAFVIYNLATLEKRLVIQF
jgi:ATP-dependent Clp protease protease subunit